ncbi:ATP-binding cassette domain-containing protein [Flavobacteriaceae bacterium F08102]|nr:ATP-binding cassette domain-containing protein [Flavobacteriaceae bacterium F08102]
MIEVRNVYKEFDGVPILKGIDATFENGKTSLVIGTSGSGKTVLLKCMLGLFRPERGSISYDGQKYKEMSVDQRLLLRQEIGMVFQGSALFDSSTVRDNVMFPLKMFTRQSVNEMKARVDEVLDRVNLPDAHNKYPAELSGGMQKRVAIARAIVMNPKYLFCDEPNSGLDPKTSTVIDNLIQEITKDYNITTIINSHDMNSVMEIGEKIIFLKNGVKEWEGTSHDVFRTDNEALTDFVYSSNLFQKVRKAQLAEAARDQHQK